MSRCKELQSLVTLLVGHAVLVQCIELVIPPVIDSPDRWFELWEQVEGTVPLGLAGSLQHDCLVMKHAQNLLKTHTTRQHSASQSQSQCMEYLQTLEFWGHCVFVGDFIGWLFRAPTDNPVTQGGWRFKGDFGCGPRLLHGLSMDPLEAGSQSGSHPSHFGGATRDTPAPLEAIRVTRAQSPTSQFQSL